MKRSLPLFLLLMLVSSLAYADSTTGGGTLKSFFTIPPGDQSVALLSKIFGMVGVSTEHYVLPGTQMGLMGTMFNSFNNVMLVLNTIVVGYAAIFGMISSAHEGEFLGKKFNSIWVPVRATAGIALLIPTASGYCVLQIIMMWIVLQGIGAGDHIWNSVVNYIAIGKDAPHYHAGGASSGPGKSTTSQLAFQAQLKAKSILTSLICMHYQYYMGQGGTDPKSVEKSDSLMPYASVNTTTNQTTIYFSPLTGGTENSICGTVKFTNGAAYSPPEKGTSTASAENYYQAQAFDTLFYGNTTASGQVSTPVFVALNNAAKQFVYQGMAMASDPTDPNTYPSGYLTGQPIVVAGNTIADQMSDAQANLLNFLNSNAQLDQQWQTAENDGWAYAGVFFHQLSTQYAKASTVTSKLFSNLSTNDPAKNSNWTSTLSGAVGQLLTTQGSGVSPTLNSLTQVSAAWQFGSYTGSEGTLPIKAMMNWMVYAFVEMLTHGNGILIDGKMIPDNTNPIAGIQQFGENIINTTEMIWTIIFVLLLVGIIVTGLSAAVDGLMGVMFLLLKIFPFIMGVLGILFVSGLIYSVYVPLIPYIVYLFAVIGWFIAVIETMLAAPLVAMGLTHPEGHEVYGRAEPAVMLMLNVFTRPALMIFGLIGGMLLSRIGLDLLNNTFSYVVLADAGTNLTANKDGSFGASGHTSGYGIGPLQLILYIIIYLALVIEIVNKSFSLIHVIPDSVLRWIGNQHQFGEYAQGEREVAGQAASGAGKTAEGGLPGEGASKAMGGASKMTGFGQGFSKSRVGQNLAKMMDKDKNKAGGGDAGGAGAGAADAGNADAGNEGEAGQREE